ncbi:MAG: hypothetical protein GY826_19550 [Fuerstiella sp.]|nr:hypothetical protein [Fuerstiella sp.]
MTEWPVADILLRFKSSRDRKFCHAGSNHPRFNGGVMFVGESKLDLQQSHNCSVRKPQIAAFGAIADRLMVDYRKTQEIGYG